jgi:hypothetical protein
VEVKADTEHQQDDPDLGKLSGEGGVADEAGSMRTHDYAGEQIAYDRRQSDLPCDNAQQPGAQQGCGDRRQEGSFVGHRASPSYESHRSQNPATRKRNQHAA